MPLERIAPELVERIPLDQLTHLRGNPRRGDHARIRESLLTHGQVEPLIINRGSHTGVPNEIVSGNNRAAVMRDLGWTEVAVSWIDAPNRVALNKIAVTLNKTGDHATWDDRALADLMASIAAEADLTGTGMSSDEYDDLMRATDTYGDAAAGFLGGLLGGDDDAFGEPAQSGPPRSTPSGADGASGGGTGTPGGGGGDEKANVTNGYVTVQWTLLPEERDIIREATRIAQSKLQTGTAGAALVSICDAYRRENA